MCPRLEVPLTISSFENKFCKGSLGGGKGSLGGCKCSWAGGKDFRGHNHNGQESLTWFEP